VLWIRIRDPDPYWIRIQSDHWIRIRNLNTDPDPGGQKWPTEVEQIHVLNWSVGWPHLWAGGFFSILDILYGGLGIGKLQFLIKKKFFFFSCNFFFNIWSLKPWIRIGSGSGIRIRIGLQRQTLDPDPKKWIRIHNTAQIWRLEMMITQRSLEHEWFYSR